MPLTRFVADVVGVVTICLVALLILLGLICIFYSLYLRCRIYSQGFIQLNYFTGPWIVRITYILFAIWWGLGEIARLDFLRQERVLSDIGFEWQETVCRGYIISNMGFSEPCLFLSLVLLLRAPLQKVESGPLSQKWNGKALRSVVLWCFPVLVLQLTAILAGPKLNHYRNGSKLLPDHFIRAATAFSLEGKDTIALCTFPLLSTIIFGVFATILTLYLMWVGRRIYNLVISQVLQRRIYIIILLAAVCLPLRYILLGLTALSKPQEYLFQALAFMAFLAPLSCILVCIFILVYCPAADSLALGSLQDLEARRRADNDQSDVISLIANQSYIEESSRNSPGRISGASTKTESISFRTDDRTGAFVELSLFSPSRDGSPQFQGWPMRPTPQPTTAGTGSDV
uniref:Uncharacterized protein n=1 Tax=Kalanchoe fedtschenkoi TaxID=63787 RepID=A0A7N0R8W2_KALFE